MHKLKPILYLILICFFSFTACNDDDDDAGPQVAENTVSINNQTINLSGGFLVDGMDPGGNADNYFLVMSSSTNDDIVLFSIFVPEGQQSITGTYNAGAPSGTQAGTFNFATIGINCEEDANGDLVCEREYMTGNAPTGTLTISKSGNIYTVDFDAQFGTGTGEANIRGLGNFKGSIFNAP